MSNFADWWQQYPRGHKNGKIACRKSYARQVKILQKEQPDSDPHEYLLAALERYKQSKRVAEGYIKNPLTWLNAGCYYDELEPAEKPRESVSRMDDTTKAELRRAAAVKAERLREQQCNHTHWWQAPGASWKATKKRVACAACGRFYGYIRG